MTGGIRGGAVDVVDVEVMDVVVVVDVMDVVMDVEDVVMDVEDVVDGAEASSRHGLEWVMRISRRSHDQDGWIGGYCCCK